MKPHDPITLRKFRLADMQAVQDLLLETVHVSYTGVYPPSAIRRFTAHHDEEQILADAKEGFIIVALRGRRIVGTGTLTGNKIKRVYVLPSEQRRGLGKRIMRRLENKARANGLDTVVLSASLVAKRFYDSLGYRLLSAKSAIMDDGERLDYFEMVKNLSDTTA